MPLPQIGDAAPDFSLKDQHGKTHDLASYAGKQVVLYFYPKDDTPGCTVQACNFRDEHAALEAAGAVVLGVSPDDVASHTKFANKFDLNFPLLADTAHATADAYGVWGEKSLYGRKFLGVTRATFLIGHDGKIARVWPKVSVDGHVAAVRDALEGVMPSVASAPVAAAKKVVASVKRAVKNVKAAVHKATERKPAPVKKVTKSAPVKKVTKPAPVKKAKAVVKKVAKKVTKAKPAPKKKR